MSRRDDRDFLDFAGACSQQLRRTAYLLCGDWDRADGYVQEALTRLYVAWPHLDQAVGLRSYARRSVISVVTAHDAPRPAPPSEPDQAPEPHPGVVAERVLLMRALAELPPRQRACVVLRYFEELTLEDAAEALGCRAATVRIQTERALTTLHSAFRRIGRELATDLDATPVLQVTW
jgi:RNA polymerase sigma factor (sigma-70 family)